MGLFNKKKYTRHADRLKALKMKAEGVAAKYETAFATLDQALEEMEAQIDKTDNDTLKIFHAIGEATAAKKQMEALTKSIEKELGENNG